MAQMQQVPPTTESRSGRAPEARDYTSGWVAFSGVMLIIGGGLSMIWGLVAVLNNHWVVWNSTNANHVYLSLRGWGWLELFLGIVVVLAGFGVFTGNIVARIVGIGVAALSLLGNFFLVPVFPFWALVIMVVDALIIYGLAAHGKEVSTY